MKKEMAYLLGALRDGCIVYNRLEFYSKNKEWILNISEMLYKLSDKKPLFRTVKKKNKDYYKIQLENKNFISELLKISEFKRPQSIWSTPSIILTSNIEIQRFYISGFFDAESNVHKHLRRGSWNIALYQAWNNDNECPPLNDIKEILSKNRIRSNRITVKTKNRQTPLFCLRMSDKRSIKLFCELIYSYHPEKLDKINQILTS